VDYWTAFARGRDPNPSEKYLEARGYWGTLGQVRSVGKWKAASARDPNLMLLEWDGGVTGLGEREQCDALGIGLDFWDTAE